MLCPSVTNEEFAELWFTREQTEFMNGIDVECEVIQLRKSKMGLKSGDMLDHIKYLKIYNPTDAKWCTEYMYDYTMEMIQDKNNEI